MTSPGFPARSPFPVRLWALALMLTAIAPALLAQPPDKFRQLEELLPTPTTTRTGSGAPGPGYWQQRADYEIDVELDDEKQRISGKETITYTNNSPDRLTYLWLQLDPNLFAPASETELTAPAPDMNRISFDDMRRLVLRQAFDGGVRITAVKDEAGKPLAHVIVKTMMRVDLPQPLGSGQTTRIAVEWNYQINDDKISFGRTGYEFFEKDGNYLYEIAQWYPRVAAYTDVTGWQHKQYLGRGEFTLELGNYVVRITTPNDHIVGATGTLLNADEVLSADQKARLAQAATAAKPVFIVTLDEAKAAEARKPTGKKTWIYKADNVRDFAFASSRKFLWDAQGHQVGGQRVMAMSLYPKEAEPLWSKYSTQAIIHTLNVYSRYTFDYPYPVAISVNGPVYGMEYPMICFNGPRPEEDGTYSKATKYGLISVVIHEVGHNYFPMVVNSDERQWTWMDEGINTFLQYLAEQEWEENYPSDRGEPRDIVGYMKGGDQVPIMTNSESIRQFGNNAYAKPATALNILRETILGRELFDFAFKEYARRWQFKRPMPADFFRTIEDASGVDLDWFWRGWFYGVEPADIAIRNVRLYTLDTQDPNVEKPKRKAERDAKPKSISDERNRTLPKRLGAIPELKDFYNDFDELAVTPQDQKDFENFLKRLDNKEKELLKITTNFYVVDFENVGGLIMPILLRIDYEDGSTEELAIPAEIWRLNPRRVSKLVMTAKNIKSLTLDPKQQTADVDEDNNHFPPRIAKSRFKMFKDEKKKNPMQSLKEAQAPAKQ